MAAALSWPVRRYEVVTLLIACLSCGGIQNEPRTDSTVASPSAAVADTQVAMPTPVVAEAASPSDAPLEGPLDAGAALRAQTAAQQALFEETFPLYGVSYHYLAQIFSEPSSRGIVVGYMRRGAQFRAKPAVHGNGCNDTWHEVVGGGFICRNRGYQLGTTPQTFEPSPIAASLYDALPYAYAKTFRSDVPQYWRIPTLEEEARVKQHIDEVRAQPAIAKETNAEPAGVVTTGNVTTTTSVASTNAKAATADAGVALSAVENVLPEILRMRMLPGFYVSVDRAEQSDDGREFYRTVRGAYVPAAAFEQTTPPDARGIVLGGAWSLPVGFVYRGGTKTLRREDDAFRVIGDLERHTPLRLSPDVLVQKNERYRTDDEGHTVRESALRIAEPVARPREVKETDRWIHIRLSQQLLVAYQGDTPVFTTVMSSGREGFETPAGLYRIQSKHVSTTMQNTNMADEAYSIEDVPWTMYFEGGYALHAAFWHDSFGRTRSHGCINLSPADARWLFQWTTPALPLAWHGMIATNQNPGTWVWIEP